MEATFERKAAIVWCTDGGDYDYWEYSIASFRATVHMPVDYYVITPPSSDLHGLDVRYGLRRIDPTPYLRQVGFTQEGYDRLHHRWPMAILHKLCTPLVEEFRQYDAVMTLDTDVMAMPLTKTYSVDDVLAHPLGEFEIAGVPDLYEPLDRDAYLIRDRTPEHIRAELAERVWSKFGYGCQAYISAGLFIWNIPVIRRDIDWYVRRCQAFWGNIKGYIFPEQDFVNQFMAVDSRLQSTFGARASGNGPYTVADACMRHFTGKGKRGMHRIAANIPEITPLARFKQAGIRPRATMIDPQHNPSHASTARCVVWSCGADDSDVRRLGYSVDSLLDACRGRLGGIGLFVLTEGPWLAKKFHRDGVSIVDIDALIDRTGFRGIDNWRSGFISWPYNRCDRLLVPFVPALRDYDLALYLEHDMLVASDKMLDVFDEDIRGYDYGMAAEFSPSHGLFWPHRHVRFCQMYLQGSDRVLGEKSDILCRLNAGCYYSSSVFLCNMAEARRTFRSVERLGAIGCECIGAGAPAFEHNVFNCACRIKRIAGAYNTAGTTHFIAGEPAYCVHAGGTPKAGEAYPTPRTAYY